MLVFDYKPSQFSCAGTRKGREAQLYGYGWYIFKPEMKHNFKRLNAKLVTGDAYSGKTRYIISVFLSV
jgi:hypothetical protein